MEKIIMDGVALASTTCLGEMIKATVKEYISPRIKKFYENSKIEKEWGWIEEDISEYLNRAYKNNEYINTIVFKNEQKKIEEIYMPLTVVKHVENRENENLEILIDKYDEFFIPVYNKILLVDNAGMGKSTIMRYIYLNVIKQKVGIPMLIELRRLDKDMSIVDFIIKEINGINKEFNKDILLELIEGGDFIFFFDGYDEISLENKRNITENIQDFIDKAYKNKFIIASREEDELNSFGEFQRFDIKALEKQEAYELIKIYDENGELSKELIDKLEKEENLRILEEFLENPLMVSLLYKAFEYKKKIPYKKHIFYDQVYNALFEEHDLSKGAFNRNKKSGLGIDDFHRILRCIGFITLSRGISYSREELINII
ncbi:NACHT domain-containing protein, partial [Clostridium perfringens]|uniref:NACHT domain-containing protein n=1 Tax=Clostridium perfringens TaxID=1502 RepID=UPI001FA97EA6